MFTKRVFVMCCLLISMAGITSAADTRVNGNVILNGVPLASGKVTFYLKSGEFVGTAINNGLYSFTKVQIPAGSFRVAIEGKGVPAKYAHAEATPLRIEVKSGDNHFDFDLTK